MNKIRTPYGSSFILGASVTLSALLRPNTDPTPIFEFFRGSYATELLTAAVCHFDLFGRIEKSPRTLDELGGDLKLASRPTIVLTTALRAMGLLTTNDDGEFLLTELAGEHLLPGGAFDVGGYIGLAARSPGVLEMVERLKSNRPATGTSGAAFIYREGIVSAMDESESARHFTMALAGRAKNVAPHLARAVDLSQAKLLVDVGGGSGIYSIALLQQFPQLQAIVFDRAEVLKVAEEMAEEYGVADRLRCQPGDMFADPIPEADAILLSNILHDWDVPQCRQLIERCAAALKPQGQLLIHDVFIDDSLPLALYSAALFTLTEGRLYSAAEYSSWMSAAGLAVGFSEPTLVHCGVITGVIRDATRSADRIPRQK